MLQYNCGSSRRDARNATIKGHYEKLNHPDPIKASVSIKGPGEAGTVPGSVGPGIGASAMAAAAANHAVATTVVVPATGGGTVQDIKVVTDGSAVTAGGHVVHVEPDHHATTSSVVIPAHATATEIKVDQHGGVILPQGTEIKVDTGGTGVGQQMAVAVPITVQTADGVQTFEVIEAPKEELQAINLSGFTQVPSATGVTTLYYQPF